MLLNRIFFFCYLLVVGCACSSLSTADQRQAVLDPSIESPTLAFPGAEGFGKFTTGGRGGRILKVTNLDDSGPGSFREAVEKSVGPRIVIFEVSGNILLEKKIRIREGNLTIAGQSAPGMGVTIQNYDVMVDADNVIIQFLRFRLGDLSEGQDSDALWGRYHQNIIIDHCSVSWSVDETASFYANKNFTLQWCFVTESLNGSGHVKGSHGYGGIWGGNEASFHHNLLAHHKNRNPRLNGGGRSGISNGPFQDENVELINNVIYNWVDNSMYGGENGRYDIIANYYKPGPGTPKSKRNRLLQVYYDDKTAFYLQDNFLDGFKDVSGNNWLGVDYHSGSEALVKKSKRLNVGMTNVQSATEAYHAVLDRGGASLVRDPVDQRIAREVKDGKITYKGSISNIPGIIDSQADVGGWPSLEMDVKWSDFTDSDSDGIPDVWERAHGLDPHSKDASSRSLDARYDNIEVYLHSLVSHLYR